MDRLPPTALVLASVLALAACRDSSGGATTNVTGVTGVTTVTTGPSTGTTDGSTSSSSGGSDVGSSTTSTATTEPGTSTTTSTSTTSTSTTTTGDETTTGDASSTTMLDPVEACLAKLDPGEECEACICTDCLMLWDACHADEGCTAIQKCAQINGCYRDQCDGVCATIMNFYGPPDSPSRTAWKALTTCLKATCRPLCPW